MEWWGEVHFRMMDLRVYVVCGSTLEMGRDISTVKLSLCFTWLFETCHSRFCMITFVTSDTQCRDSSPIPGASPKPSSNFAVCGVGLSHLLVDSLLHQS